MKTIIAYVLPLLISCSKPTVNHSEIKLDLRGKHLTAIPNEVLENTNIVYLDLGSCEISFYPPLSTADHSKANSLTKLPERIGKLTKLKTLILNTNKLTTLPNSITKLKQLEVLDLSINTELDIVKELDKLKRLPNLKVLKIVDVKLSRDDFEVVKKSLSPEIKIIVTIQEYADSIN
ncbi:leucine-rich repeat domain-containing protein [Adhaeribacter pallidiroseus]|uniref:Adenylate cyclase n=1 Tax=Adhaeribacter pallidiroseus TaxID=2072847 RepID=A0A369QAJ3_9BACT|nr:hypothetical protein [Adhaeribacter pallidiroseus]RDC61933.1 Adenylate cyclase [Adhaeribacter pallidiroseus]